MSNLSSRATALAAAAACACALSAPALAIVTAAPLDRPDNGYIGRWNGASAVAIGQQWILTARHVGGNLQDRFRMRQVEYRADARYAHPSADLMLVHLADALPGWHTITADAAPGAEVILGGMGRTAGAQYGLGYDWGGMATETWGMNRLEWAWAGLLAFDFDAGPLGYTAIGGAMEHEAGFAVLDSGGGVFVRQADGSLSVAGVAVAVSHWGYTGPNAWSFAVSLAPHAAWITSVLGFDPFVGASAGVPVPAPGAAAAIACLALATLRRRR